MMINMWEVKQIRCSQWRNYVRRSEAAASGRQDAGGATEFNENDL